MATNNSTTDPCLTPLMDNPSGGPPNFAHHTMFQPITIGVGSVVLVITTSFVALRCLGSLGKNRQLFLDDYICIVAFLLTFAWLILEILIRQGFGHAWDMNQCQTTNKRYGLMASIQFAEYYLALIFAKATVCVLYLRVFASRKEIRYTVWVVMVILTLMGLVGFSIAMANNVKQGWTDEITGAVNMDAYQVLLSVFTILADLTLLALPIRPIMQLSLSLRKKLGLLAVFLVGIGATAFTVCVLYWLIEYYYRVEKLPQHLRDWTWIVSEGNLFMVVELFVTIMLSCIPGVVAAWRNVLHDSLLVTRIRALINSKRSKASTGDVDGESDVDKFKVVVNDKTVHLNEV